MVEEVCIMTDPSPVVPSVGAVPVEVPDADGIMRRFDQEISRSRDVIGRMDMGRTGGSVASSQPYSDVPGGYHVVEDADGERLVRNSAQAFCGRLPGHLPHGNCGGYPPSAATPAEPVDEVVCPNCEHTIRARMSDQPGMATPTELDDGEHVKVFHQHEDGSEVEGRIRDCCGDDAPVPAGQDGRR